MGIGTSRGMYYDDEFQHQAGVPTLPKGDEDMEKKPKDTGDDNVLPPEEGSYDKPTKGLTRVVITKPDPSENILDSDVATPEPYGLNPPEGNAIQSYVKNIEDDIKNAPSKFLQDAEEAKKRGTKLTYTPEEIDSAINTAVASGGVSGMNAMHNFYSEVSQGRIPMWAMTPNGEFHASVEALDAAKVNTPVTIHMRGSGLEALEEYHQEPYDTQAHEQFQQLLRQVRRNQPSTIGEGEILPNSFEPGTPEFNREYGYPMGMEDNPGHPMSGVEASNHFHSFSNSRDAIHFAHEYEETATPAQWEVYERHVNDLSNHPDSHFFRQEPFEPVEELTPAEHVGPNHHLSVHPDRMSDAEFYHWGEYQPENGMTPAQEERWLQLDQREGERLRPQDTGRRQDAYRYDEEEEPSPIPHSWNQDIRDKLTTALNSKTIQMFKDNARSFGRNHEFRFASENGVGKIELTERNAGKELHVDIMGKVRSSGAVDWDQGPHSFGNKEVKEMIKHLMKEFPKAEYITGFRVSGARQHAGHGGMDARLNLPGRGKKD